MTAVLTRKRDTSNASGQEAQAEGSHLQAREGGPQETNLAGRLPDSRTMTEKFFVVLATWPVILFWQPQQTSCFHFLPHPFLFPIVLFPPAQSLSFIIYFFVKTTTRV